MRYNLEKFQFAGIEICSSPLIDGHTNEKKSLKFINPSLYFCPTYVIPPSPNTAPNYCYPHQFNKEHAKKSPLLPHIIIIKKYY